MKNKTNTCKEYRTDMKMRLHDVATILNMDASNLAKVEYGTRGLKAPVILLYHLLYDLPLTTMLKGTFQSLKAGWKRRAVKLLAEIKAQQSPQSPLRISCIQRFVNMLDNEDGK